MKDFLIKALMAILANIVEKYITKEMLEEWEMKAKEFAYEKLKELAASTEWTQIDDELVEKIGKAWGVIEA